jgi:hypothetical protein
MTTFVDRETVITASWLNAADAVVNNAFILELSGISNATERDAYFTAAISVFTDTASGTKVRVSRPNPDGTSKIFIKNIDDVMRGRASADSTDGSFVLEPGDLIYVPEKII